MWTALSTILAKLAISFYESWAKRQAIKDVERGKMALEAAKRARRALEYKVSHPPGSSGFLFRVRKLGKRITLLPPRDTKKT